VSEPVVSLNGDRKISLTPGKAFWKDRVLNYTNLNRGNYERMIKPKDTYSGEINILLLPDN
jgi:hypothetical protein